MVTTQKEVWLFPQMGVETSPVCKRSNTVNTVVRQATFQHASGGVQLHSVGTQNASLMKSKSHLA